VSEVRKATNPRANIIEIYPLSFGADLLESMREQGYSFRATLSDIIDNSLSAAPDALNYVSVRTTCHTSPSSMTVLA
jgi:hypothetical protein